MVEVSKRNKALKSSKDPDTGPLLYHYIWLMFILHFGLGSVDDRLFKKLVGSDFKFNPSQVARSSKVPDDKFPREAKLVEAHLIQVPRVNRSIYE